MNRGIALEKETMRLLFLNFKGNNEAALKGYNGATFKGHNGATFRGNSEGVSGVGAYF